MKEGSEDGENFQLDVVVAASGFKKSDQKVLEEVRLLTTVILRVYITLLLVSGHYQGARGC